MHGPLAKEAKRLLQADLENITLENVQTCCIIANLCEWDCNRSSGALFFRIALGMAEIMDLSAPDTESPIAEREMKRRVWWTLFAADRWFSSGLRLSRQLEDFQKSIELPMDEDIFHALDPTDMALSVPWKPGLWAHMVGLHQLFGPVLDLNRRCAQGNMPSHEREATVMDIAGRLAAWEDMVPSGDKMTDENFHLHRQRGTGGPFVSLHLAYNYYSLLLYFQYLAHQQPQAPTVQTYVQRCKQCAGAYSYLVKMSRDHAGCEAVFPTASHMTVVSSSVLLHTLLFGDEWEVASARGALNSNFEVLVDFQQYWPELIAQMIHRLTSFQEMCLLASARNHPTHEFDNWMLRFVVEFALPLEERSFALRAVEEARATVDMHAARFAEQGRITDFGVFQL
ncbi:uncharacterized protein F5Z01DRAFT_625168 [Emericellopsis atlantica]|uniref:Xylanolytic transcriptional activator regulatory domain-containing protein n=1 Tax=Emericellopsis atlantica TaxID=2614577 RepID=A0A9P7ZIF2_9HYPO|nr:uncharacterized protein F5Z01DRAFT_625168 [Emericellopsis atlantica]KAG9252713.1 hypothetical protein F5Z01DRAFT_625168 [Emericellopsis atlantica]